ncbi:MAG TPA: zinc-binding dehydrogenase [Microthrixaceae bacterium]|nr:zinc-binding dehydrogenase [Microthrixaceae bacterium]
MTKIRAALLTRIGGPLEYVDDVEIGDPGPGEVRVAVHSCGLCHSDVSQVDGVHPVGLPVILGHEAAGVVIEVGVGVMSLQEGDHVVLSPVSSCGRCAYCLRGEFQICVNSLAIAMAMHPDGTTRLSRGGEIVYRGVGLAAMAEQVIVAESGAVKVPSEVPLDVACVIGCAVQTGVGAAINTAKVAPGDTVLVMGAGGIGVSIVQGAKVAGASRIIVSDPIEERREWAMSFGATDVVDPTVDDVATRCRSLTEIGVDHAFDAVGHSALVECGINATRSGGTTVMVGAAPIDHMASVSLVGAMYGEKKLVGSLLGGCWAPRDIPKLVELWQQGQIDVDSMVTARRPLAEVNEAIADMKAGRGIRTVLRIAE